MLKDRIKEIRKHLKISSQKDFADKLNWKIGRIQDLESGKVKEMKAEEAEQIQEKFLINGWWLLTGQGEMKKETGEQNEDNFINKMINELNDSEKRIVLNLINSLISERKL